ncbi:MAG: putative glycosyltransferase [Parcubacteria group bacterium Greene0714_7]|nr:MAG: putative glycosyltransferase [Parcubacteria group bacterium Greene0714_7]
MKIVVLQDDLPPYHVGGGGIIAYRLAKEFARRGHEVTAITTVQDRAHAGSELVDGMKVVRLYSSYHPRLRAYKSLYNGATLRDVERLLKKCAPDIVHVHNVHTHLSYYSLVLARRYGKRVVMTEHDAMSFHFGKLPSAPSGVLNELPDEVHRESIIRQLRMHKWRYNPLRTPIVRYILRKTVHASVAVSTALARALENNGIRVHSVIHNGIAVSEWGSINIDTFVKKHHLGDRVIFFGGRLSEPKGAIQMIQAMPAICNTVPGVQLLVAGKQDAFAERMVKHATELGVEKNLVFTGWITGDDLRSAYLASRVVVAPSIYLDPFPTVNLEAFAVGRPVVATCFGGSREVVEDGVSGYVVNPLDVEALSAKVADLLMDKEKAKRFGVAGYERVTTDFTLEGQAHAYEKLFAELC